MHSKCYNFVMLYTSSLERWFASGKRCHLSSITVFKLHDGSILRHVYLTANSLFLYYDLETLHSFIYLINTFWANLLLIRRHSRSWGYEDCQDKCCFPKNMAWKKPREASELLESKMGHAYSGLDVKLSWGRGYLSWALEHGVHQTEEEGNGV